MTKSRDHLFYSLQGFRILSSSVYIDISERMCRKGVCARARVYRARQGIDSITAGKMSRIFGDIGFPIVCDARVFYRIVKSD